MNTYKNKTVITCCRGREPYESFITHLGIKCWNNESAHIYTHTYKSVYASSLLKNFQEPCPEIIIKVNTSLRPTDPEGSGTHQPSSLTPSGHPILTFLRLFLYMFIWLCDWKKKYKKVSKNWNPHTLLVGMQNGAATLENNLVVPQAVKHRVTT